MIKLIESTSLSPPFPPSLILKYYIHNKLLLFYFIFKWIQYFSDRQGRFVSQIATSQCSVCETCGNMAELSTAGPEHNHRNKCYRILSLHQYLHSVWMKERERERERIKSERERVHLIHHHHHHQPHLGISGNSC